MKTRVNAESSQNGGLAFEQIKEIVGDGWGVIKEPVYDGCILLKGELLFHSDNEEVALDEMRVMRKEHHVLFKYFGERNPNIIYTLNIKTL